MIMLANKDFYTFCTKKSVYQVFSS
uniref:Uncharacterized protein n=1 Tax=Rhizophora mucronata TaxID=61149 RepID=A0A2P2Q311_RHIMU